MSKKRKKSRRSLKKKTAAQEEYSAAKLRYDAIATKPGKYFIATMGGESEFIVVGKKRDDGLFEGVL